MSSYADKLADAIASTEELLTRYLEGFGDDNATAQAPHLPNHAAWILGHLAMTMHRAAELISDETMPLDWDPERYAFGSTPAAEREAYPPLATLIERYRDAMSKLVAAVRAAGDDRLQRPVTWGSSRPTAGDLAMRMVFHNGTHCGQLVDLRRALELPAVIR